MKNDQTIPKKSIYKVCKDSENGSPKHNVYILLHFLLEKYSKFLDSNHFSQLKKDTFHPRRGELYFAALIKEFNDNVKIETFKNGGPDFKISINDGRYFLLEVIVPGDSNTKQDLNQMLRSIKKSLQEKERQRTKYFREKTIHESDIFVISIGLYGFDSILAPCFNDFINHICKLLLNPKMKNISAIILSKDCDQIAMMNGVPVLFNDLHLIHNPFANNPLPIHTLNVYREYNNAERYYYMTHCDTGVEMFSNSNEGIAWKNAIKKDIMDKKIASNSCIYIYDIKLKSLYCVHIQDGNIDEVIEKITANEGKEDLHIMSEQLNDETIIKSLENRSNTVYIARGLDLYIMENEKLIPLKNGTWLNELIKDLPKNNNPMHLDDDKKELIRLNTGRTRLENIIHELTPQPKDSYRRLNFDEISIIASKTSSEHKVKLIKKNNKNMFIRCTPLSNHFS